MRIEDDVLVTDDAAEVLTARHPEDSRTTSSAASASGALTGEAPWPSERSRRSATRCCAQPARAVGPDELRAAETQQFIDDLVETMRDADGAGLAATQSTSPCGSARSRCATTRATRTSRTSRSPSSSTRCIDPLGDERFDNYEGCLSVPNLRGVVPRFVEIRVRALDRHGEPIDRVVRGLTAGTYQHEVDHLDGKLFLDRVADTTTLCTWEAFRKYHEAAFIERVQKIVARFGS